MRLRTGVGDCDICMTAKNTPGRWGGQALHDVHSCLARLLSNVQFVDSLDRPSISQDWPYMMCVFVSGPISIQCAIC